MNDTQANTQRVGQQAEQLVEQQVVREKIDGIIERFIFRSEETGFSVFILTHQKNSPVTVTGTFHGITAGQEVQLSGVWRLHKKFGKQFEALECNSLLPTTLDGLRKYLGSGLIKGVGKIYAEKLVERFGLQVLTIIDKAPERLLEVPGIGAKRAEQIGLAWCDQREVARIMVFLQEKGVSAGYATKIYKQYRDQAIDIVQENPYRLADDIWGISFKIADQIAQKVGIHVHSPHRLNAALLFGIAQGTKMGHLYQEFTALIEKTRELLLFTEEEDHLIKAAFDTLYRKEKVILLQDNGLHYATAPQYYYSEQFIAQKLRALLVHPSFNTGTFPDVAHVISQTAGIVLNSEQMQGIHACLKNKVTIITGGPGTGKTTLVRTLLAILDAGNLPYKLAAPTGRAAKRLCESSGRQATTIHRLLEFDPSIMAFKNNERNPIKAGFFIIDEASMIDVFLAQSLLKAIPLHAHVVFLGDINQLPSVGAGNFLHDCIASMVIPTIRLIEIFRQARDSLIVVNAHRIHQGEFPTLATPQSAGDFMFIKEENAEYLEGHLKRAIFVEAQQKGILPTDVTVLCPMNRGGSGTHALNSVLQNFFNPEKKDALMNAGTAIKLGDKVMQIRNNYDKLVFNGDVGILQAINREDSTFTVNFEERMVSYEFDELDEIVLAYALTIHKSQGSEYAAVVIPLFMHHFALLQRNLIYTAVTRAKKLCIFIGQSKALAIALRNNKGIKRVTFLTTLLQQKTGEA